VTAMRRIVLGFLSTVTVVVLLFGYHTSTSSKTSDGTVVASPASGGTGGSGTGADAGTDSGSSSGTSTGATTVTGDAASTRWGPVQVQLTVSDGKVTAVDVVEYPDGNGRDQQINARALPVLVQETLDAQSAKIDMVSGATVTSDGYVESLQSALDKAGLS
jgi:uncharacterized protein with FMN-binding domain